ncbi:flagellin [Comamonas thiooxydans]|uniref:Flagellin n=1 Tax=Comamonas thiooxydans TaxID=363952 RepID=A0AA42PZ03_9BURK|nr:flagellin [Comamonas thiooxydans]MDH1334222.1 flagellin [Comamonas thiooxydans]MDH1740183.1 flagellin [Comamonas thiooxydans]MDH1786564.1 flagellin [Comamonas thiooxydans]
MAMTINTNIQSLNAQRNLGASQSSLATSMQRLSSGLRINSAKDDAAGLAIAERMSAQVRGLNQAQRNANDGVSLAQTAEGALGTIGGNLQRIRELAVQSRNATNSTEDRQALDAEVQQLKLEIQRVAEQTSFNGTKLLNGNFQNQAFQVGADQGQIINIASIADANISKLGQWTSVPTSSSVTAAVPTGTAAAGGGGTAATSGKSSFDFSSLKADFSTTNATFDVAIDGASPTTVTLNKDYSSDDGTQLVSDIGTALGSGVTVAVNGTDIEITSKTDGTTSTVAVSNFTGVTGAPTPTETAGTAATGGGTGGATFDALSGGNLKINGKDIAVQSSGNAALRASDLVKAINAKTAETDVTASLVDGKLQLKSSKGDIKIESDLAGTKLTEQTGLTAGTTAGGALTGSTAYAAGQQTDGFQSLSVTDETSADNAILAMDAALKSVNSARAELGAMQNRFESVVSNLSVISENLSASKGRIMDADFASETANLSRSQILQQAGTAMVAQANQLPQGVLSLLR